MLLVVCISIMIYHKIVINMNVEIANTTRKDTKTRTEMREKKRKQNRPTTTEMNEKKIWMAIYVNLLLLCILCSECALVFTPFSLLYSIVDHVLGSWSCGALQNVYFAMQKITKTIPNNLCARSWLLLALYVRTRKIRCISEFEFEYIQCTV